MDIISVVQLFLIFLQLHTCIASAPTPLWRTKRRNDPSNHVSLRPIFNTTALSVNGTSGQLPNVQTKVYIPPSTASASNLTGRQQMGERRMINCEYPTATFHHSHCRHRNEIGGSIREYVIWCRHPVPSHLPRPTFTLPTEARAMASSITTEDTSLYAEVALCDPNEVCIDSLYSIDWREGMVLIANCVKKSLFEDAGLWKSEWDDIDEDEEGELYWTGEWREDGEDETPTAESSQSGLPVSGSEGKGEDHRAQKPTSGAKQQQQSQSQHLLNTFFAGKYATIVVTSDEEGNTPLQVEKIGLRSLGNKTTSLSGGRLPPGPNPQDSGNSGTTGSDQKDFGNEAPAAPLGIAEQERNCTNCIDLRTVRPFSSDTKALEMEVKLAGVGTTAIAGVLWLALLSG